MDSFNMLAKKTILHHIHLWIPGWLVKLSPHHPNLTSFWGFCNKSCHAKHLQYWSCLAKQATKHDSNAWHLLAPRRREEDSEKTPFPPCANKNSHLLGANAIPTKPVRRKTTPQNPSGVRLQINLTTAADACCGSTSWQIKMFSWHTYLKNQKLTTSTSANQNNHEQPMSLWWFVFAGGNTQIQSVWSNACWIPETPSTNLNPLSRSDSKSSSRNYCRQATNGHSGP